MHPLPSFFNCSNDMALAANVRRYKPPRRIQQMEADLAALSQVWADTRFAGPWGWSLAARQRYIDMGVESSALPCDEWLSLLRRLSSREYACRYVAQLLQSVADARLLGHEMRFINKGEQLPQTSFPLITKTPWSSSGRGIRVLRPADRRPMVEAADGLLVDRFYDDKEIDFAMEFFVGEAGAEFLGYSVFQASADGRYGYNLVASQDELLKYIGVDADLLDALVNYHLTRLPLTGYRGPVGIDMLRRSDGTAHPCLELNFRLNMGILALLLCEAHGSCANIELTPRREHGFQAVVSDGHLQILFTT